MSTILAPSVIVLAVPLSLIAINIRCPSEGVPVGLAIVRFDASAVSTASSVVSEFTVSVVAVVVDVTLGVNPLLVSA
jgi:hypothetical protein